MPTGGVAGRGKARQSAVAPEELRAALTALDLSQGKFAKLIGVSRESVNRACSPHGGRVLITIALGLRYVRLIADLRELLAADRERLGRRRLRAAIRRAEQPVCAPLKRRRSPNPSKLRAPVPPAFVAPPTAPPTSERPSDPAPAGYYWVHRNYTWMLARMPPEYGGLL
jgi:hypothetical protein